MNHLSQIYLPQIFLSVFLFSCLLLSPGLDWPDINESSDEDSPIPPSMFFIPPNLSLPQKIRTSLQGITFDSDYDNGSLSNITEIGHNQFTATPYIDQGEIGRAAYWFRFRMIGVTGRSIMINLRHSGNPRPFLKVGTAPWRRMTAEETPESATLNLTFSEAENEAEIAYFAPLGYEETMLKVNRLIQLCPYASAEVFGQSTLGLNLWMLTVSDNSTPSTQKHRVWVQSRIHAGEVTGTFVMLGFLKAFAEDSSLGQTLRRHFIANIAPILNTDGVWLGHTRWDSLGIDPERQWCFPDRIPEVQSLKKLIDRLMLSSNPIEVSLNLHSTQSRGNHTFFWKHVQPSVSADFEKIQQRYIDALVHATPLFDDIGESSQLSLLTDCPDEPQEARAFLESYYWHRWGKSVMAMTHESHFNRRLTDNEWILPEDYEELGRSMAVALFEYFNLPPIQESLSFPWMLH